MASTAGIFQKAKQERPNPMPLVLKGVVMEVLGPKCNERSGTLSLVTVAALVASGQVQQITYHLNRAMDNGLTAGEASELLTHLAFYAGWPSAFSALPIVKDVLEKRKIQAGTRNEELAEK
jgi:alkylhydroperoxidase/carboxymuconolactone decarboxylase family protein YurZ